MPDASNGPPRTPVTDTDTTWDPACYARNARDRLRPALDLLAQVHHPGPRRIVDLGCGTGTVTRRLADRWPDAHVEGLDSSAEMLARARERPATIDWRRADIATWAPEEPVDVLFSNAALHWLDDHRRLLPRLFATVATGGVLAVQMPRSWDLPSHRLMRQTLRDGGPGRTPLGNETLHRAMDRKWVEEPAFYVDLLSPLADRLDVWETTYLQRLPGHDAVLEWVRATGLRPILAALGDADRTRFLDEYRRRLRVAYPRRPDGWTLYPFARLFLVARR